MNKKQLSLQNSSLFAELERKAKEIEILNIRLEDSEKKIDSLLAEKEQLSAAIVEANDEIARLNEQIVGRSTELNEQIEALKTELETAKSELATPPVAAEPLTYNIHIDEEPLDQAEASNTNSSNTSNEESQETAEDDIIEEPIDEIEADTEVACDTNEESAPEAEEPTSPAQEFEREETITESVDTPPSPAEEFTVKTSAEFFAAKSTATDSTPITDLLRDYGAKVIGKVTRVTAEVISKINVADENTAATPKTLALGKNESFKFKVMELAKEKSSPERIMAEMDFLADEAIIYLRSI